MGVYIKSMEMPVMELEWTIRHSTDGKWYAIDTNAETSDGKWHEIVPVPPHGRLIDADALCELCNNSKLKSVDANDIMRMPIIIPAEEGE